jgi:hypothetical protein
MIGPNISHHHEYWGRLSPKFVSYPIRTDQKTVSRHLQKEAEPGKPLDTESSVDFFDQREDETRNG